LKTFQLKLYIIAKAQFRFFIKNGPTILFTYLKIILLQCF